MKPYREIIITDTKIIKDIIKELTSKPSDNKIRYNEKAKQAYLNLTKE